MAEGADFTLSISTVVIEAGTSRRCVFVSILYSAEVEMEEEIQLGFDPSAEESIGDPNITTIVIASDGSKPLKYYCDILEFYFENYSDIICPLLLHCD